MRTATLIREPSNEQGTFGVLTADTGKSWNSGELNWRDNKNGISCIPEGIYRCKLIDSMKHGKCYQVMNVPNRSMIEIHAANFMGSSPKYAKQLEGCIALGKSVGYLSPNDDALPQKAILKSRQAIAEFEEEMNGSDFELTIIRGEK